MTDFTPLYARHAQAVINLRSAQAAERAARAMVQPAEGHPHRNHFHVRIYCSRADRERGCEDTGPIWAHEKKTYKYGGPERYDPALTEAFLARPFFFVHG